MLKTFSQRHDAAVLEQKTLHDEHRGHHHHRRAGSEQGRHQRAADQMAGRSARHRKIHHLRREQERRGQAEQRNPSGRQFAPHVPLGEADARGGNHRGDRRRLAVNESIRNVHKL